MIDNTLIYGLATLAVGFFGLVVRYGFKSKCSDVGLCCGLITIKRDIDGEIKAEHQENQELELGLGSKNELGSKDESKI